MKDGESIVITDFVSISADVGLEIYPEIPIDIANGLGGFARTADNPVTYGGKTYSTFVNGFTLDSFSVGQLQAETGTGCIRVKYRHLQPKHNTIWFFAMDGRTFKIDIVRVPIHDHSSLAQGGPAHGTYYSESGLQ